jgi:hypothetical protein
VILLLIVFLAAAAQATDPDSVATKEERKLQARKSPMGALLRSLAIPGWGQLYNDKYFKAVVIGGLETYFIYKAGHWWRKTEDQYDLLQQLSESEKPEAFEVYESYRGNRNDFLWLVALSVFLSMFDAYVDAHLSGFDVDLTPDIDGESRTAELTVKISIAF